MILKKLTLARRRQRRTMGIALVHRAYPGLPLTMKDKTLTDGCVQDSTFCVGDSWVS